jgi:hypothetical protein
MVAGHFEAGVRSQHSGDEADLTRLPGPGSPCPVFGGRRHGRVSRLQHQLRSLAEGDRTPPQVASRACKKPPVFGTYCCRMYWDVLFTYIRRRPTLRRLIVSGGCFGGEARPMCDDVQ